MKVIKNYLWNVFYQIFVIIVPLITMPYISRVLGPVGVGVNSYTNSIVQYFVLFGSIGINLYGNRQIAYVRDDKKRLTETFWSIFFLRFFVSFIALTVYLFFAIFIYKTYTAYLISQMWLIIAAMFDISWFFMGVENFQVTVFRNIVIKVISVILIFLLVKDHNDTNIYILILSLSTLFGNLTVFPYLKTYIELHVHHINLIKHLKPSMVLFIPQIAIQVYVVLNKTMLGKMVSVESAGYYDNSDKIVRMVIAVVTATGTVLLPHIANEFINGNITKVKKLFSLSFQFVTYITVPLIFGLAAISNKFAILFLGENFGIVGPLMMIESVAALFIAWDNAVGTQYLIPTKQNMKYTVSVTIGAIVNVVFNIPLIMIYGVIGSMIATVLSELSVTGYMLWSIRHQIAIRPLFKGSPKIIIIGLIMFFVVKILDVFLDVSWVALVFEIIVGIIVYASLTFVFMREVTAQFKKFLN